MRRTFILSVLVFLGLMGVLFYVEFGLSAPTVSAGQNAPAATTNRTNTAEKEIRAALEKYYEIALNGDREALKNYGQEITAPEYRSSSELGTMDRQEAFRLFEAAEIEFVSAAFDDFKVLVFDDTAIAKYRDVSRVRANGELLPPTATRITNVWIKRDGRWQIVAEHSSVLYAAEPASATSER